MRSKLLTQTLLIALAASSLTGCKNGRWPWQKPANNQAGQPGSINPSPVDGGMGDRPLLTGDSVHGQFVPVYFDYDSAVIKPSENSKIEAVAAALKGNDKKLVIEGYTDERGTAEYNRALGEKRAQSALKSLVSLGISASRLTTISYGKERPAEPSHDDTAWSRNRRDEFVIVAQ